MDFLSGFGGTPEGQRGLYSNLLAKQPKNVRDFYAPRFNELYNEYLGSLFQSPKQTFEGFLSGVNLPQRLGTYSPQQRNDYSARTLTPRTRFLNY